MKKNAANLFLILMTLLLLLTGCGGKSAGITGGAAADSAVSSSEQTSAAEAGWSESQMNRKETLEVAEEDVAAAEPSEMGSAMDSGAGTAQAPQANDLGNRKLIKTVSLSMETTEFDTMRSQLEQSVDEFGGYIESSDFNAPQSQYRYRYYYVTVRIPSERLEEFVGTVGELGTLTNKSENVEDVTLDYVDTAAYKESLEVEYQTVTRLLEEAEDLDQILALESKLSQLRYEINSYESQLRTYDNLIDYSTVHISVSEVLYATETSHTMGSRIVSGLTANLYSIREFFVELMIGLVVNLPTILLAAVGILIVVLLIRRILRKRKAKKQFSAAAASYAAPLEPTNQTQAKESAADAASYAAPLEPTEQTQAKESAADAASYAAPLEPTSEYSEQKTDPTPPSCDQ